MEADTKRAPSPTNASSSKSSRSARLLVGIAFVAAVVSAPSVLRWSQGAPSFAGLSDTPAYAQLSPTKVQCTGVLGDSDLTEAVLGACFEPAVHAVEIPEAERTELDKQCRPWLGLHPGHPAANWTGARPPHPNFGLHGGLGMLTGGMMTMQSSTTSKCQLYMGYLQRAPFCSTNCAKALDSFFAVAYKACGGEALFVPQENSFFPPTGPFGPNKAEQRRMRKQMAFRQRIATADRHFRELLELSNLDQLLRVLDFKVLFDLRRNAACAVMDDLRDASDKSLALNPAIVPHTMLGGAVFEPPTMGPWGVNRSRPGAIADYREGRSCSCFHNTSTITYGTTTVNLTDFTFEERRVCVCWDTPRFAPGNGTFFAGPKFANVTRLAGATAVGFPSPSHEPLTPVSEEVKKQLECAWHKKVLSTILQDARRMRPDLLDPEVLEIATAKTNDACDGVVLEKE